MTRDQALHELRQQIKQAVKDARFWGLTTSQGGIDADRAIALFWCYRALRAG